MALRSRIPLRRGALALISVRVTGIAVLETYCRSLVFMSHAASNADGETRYAMFSAQMPNLYGFFHSISHGAAWGMALTIISSLIVLLWAAMQKPSLPLALLAGILVSYHLYFYDLTLLLLPISLVFNQNIDSFTSGREKGSFYASAVLILVSVWGVFVVFDYHHLFAIPVAVLFACLSSSHDTQPVGSPSLS